MLSFLLASESSVSCLGILERQSLAICLRALRFCSAIRLETPPKTSGHDWELRRCPSPPLEKRSGLVERLGDAFLVLPPSQSGFLLGQLYTALLPAALRKSLGAYYTPPALVNRLLDLVTSCGFDWSNGRIIDPACGGAAFPGIGCAKARRALPA